MSWSRLIGDLQIIKNHFSDVGTGVFIKENSLAPITNPKVENNDILQARSYAFWLQVSEINLKQNNNVTGSANAYFLTGGKYFLENINTTSMQIPGETVTVANAKKLSIKNSDVSSSLENVGTSDIHLYNVEDIEIENVKVNLASTAIRIVWDQSLTKTISIKSSQIKQARFSGVWIQSYDATQAQALTVTGNDFQGSLLNYSNADFIQAPLVSDNLF